MSCPGFVQRSAVVSLLAWVVLCGAAAAQNKTAALPPAYSGTADEGCFSFAAHSLGHSVGTALRGLQSAPRAMLRPANLKWELPIAAATGVLITSVDTDASRRVKSPSLIDASRTASTGGLAAEFALAGIDYGFGCAAHRESARNASFTVLEAMGYGLAEDGLLKYGFRRQLPTTSNAAGRFWQDDGTSFPSGHSAISWAFASALAHEYPHKRWLKWSAYGLAAGVSALRFTAKKHFPADILVGSTLGYVTGAYLANH